MTEKSRSSRLSTALATALERSKSSLVTHNIACGKTLDTDGLVPVVSLAYAEMRLILARIIWNFDMKLADRDEKWIDHNEVYTIWEKKPLKVYMTPRKTGS